MHYHLIIKNRERYRTISRLYKALRKSFDKDRSPKDPTLKRYEVTECIIERGLNHPDTLAEVKELIAQKLLPPEGLD